MPEKNDLPPVLERLGEDLYAAMKIADTARPIDSRQHRLNRLTGAIVRTPRAATRWATAGVAAIAVGVGVFVLGSTGSAPTSAFAGWTTTPTAAAADQAQTADAECATRLAGASKNGLSANLDPEVTDTRGPYTLVIYERATCLSGPGFVSVHGQEAATGVSISTMARTGQPYTVAEGPAASDASTVTLSLEDGSKVQATVANSRFAVWWPSATRPTSVAISAPSGTHTEPLSLPPAPAAKPTRASQ
jgi:hypothetical protein